MDHRKLLVGRAHFVTIINLRICKSMHFILSYKESVEMFIKCKLIFQKVYHLILVEFVPGKLTSLLGKYSAKYFALLSYIRVLSFLMNFLFCNAKMQKCKQSVGLVCLKPIWLGLKVIAPNE